MQLHSPPAPGRLRVVGKDEPLAIKFSLKDNQAAAAYLLSRASRHRLATTATPISDRVRDLWAQLDLVQPWAFGGFYGPKGEESGFVWRYCGASEGLFGGIDTRGKSNLDELKRRLSFVSHRVPYSVANRALPPKRRLSTYVEVRDQARVEDPAGIRDMLRRARGVSGSIREVLLMEAASRKRKAVIDRVRDAIEGGLKIVVLTGRRNDAQTIGEKLEGAGGYDESTGLSKCPVWIATGADSVAARDRVREAYMAHPGPCVLVGTGDAWGEGLNLHDTDLACMVMIPPTPRQIIQWEGRFARLGQKRPVLIWYPIAEGTLDEHMAQILIEKLPAVEKVIEADEIAGLPETLVGASEEELIRSMAAKVLGEQ